MMPWCSFYLLQQKSISVRPFLLASDLESSKYCNLDLGPFLLPLCYCFSVPILASSAANTHCYILSSSSRISSPSTTAVMSFTGTRLSAGASLRGVVLLSTPLG